jgi:hypothetical protein
MTTDSAPDNEALDRAARVLAQALMEAEVIIAAERDARAPQVSPQVIETIERFGDVIARLVSFTEQLGERMTELTAAVARLAEAGAAPAAPSAAEERPRAPHVEQPYASGGEGVDVTIAAVPGFQGLMELQRALVRLPQVQSAAVRRYQDDEAAIQLVLAQPMTATSIADGVTRSTGHRIFVEDARADLLRLRLRFVGAA